MREKYATGNQLIQKAGKNVNQHLNLKCLLDYLLLPIR